jgi:hypothetical protein
MAGGGWRVAGGRWRGWGLDLRQEGVDVHERQHYEQEQHHAPQVETPGRLGVQALGDQGSGHGDQGGWV